MVDQVIKCDICGATRGIDNHWLLADVDTDAVEMIVQFSAWDAYDFEDYKHICSPTCAARLITQSLLVKPIDERKGNRLLTPEEALNPTGEPAHLELVFLKDLLPEPV